MPPVIIADASCLILLEKIAALELLSQLFGRITITDVVAAEYGLPLPEWVAVQTARDARQLQFLALTLDRGEASAIALALEQTDCLLIMDERLPGYPSFCWNRRNVRSQASLAASAL